MSRDYSDLTVTCGTCQWTAGRAFATADEWDLAIPMCSFCIAESEGRPDSDHEVPYYGCSYLLGRSCWHVTGYVNGDALRSVLLCGRRLPEHGIGGRTGDVLASGMPICKVCDQATGGGAQGDVDRLRIDLCDRCDPSGLVWDPTVFGNVVGCKHGANNPRSEADG